MTDKALGGIQDGNGGTLDLTQATQRDLLIIAHIKLDRVIKDSTDHEARLRVLEKWKYGIPVSAIAAAVAAALTQFH
jgi:hypothetical protein